MEAKNRRKKTRRIKKGEIIPTFFVGGSFDKRVSIYNLNSFVKDNGEDFMRKLIQNSERKNSGKFTRISVKSLKKEDKKRYDIHFNSGKCTLFIELIEITDPLGEFHFLLRDLGLKIDVENVIDLSYTPILNKGKNKKRKAKSISSEPFQQNENLYSGRFEELMASKKRNLGFNLIQRDFLANDHIEKVAPIDNSFPQISIFSNFNAICSDFECQREHLLVLFEDEEDLK